MLSTLHILAHEITTTRAIYSRDQYPEEARRFEELCVAEVKLLCETMWAERHTTLGEFREMYEAIIDCLTASSNNEGIKWNSTTITDAFDLHCAN